MNEFENMTNDELNSELNEVETEFNELKVSVASGLQRLNDLSEDYNNIKKELDKRKA